MFNKLTYRPMYIFKLSVTPNLIATNFQTWKNLRLSVCLIKYLCIERFHVHIREAHLHIDKELLWTLVRDTKNILWRVEMRVFVYIQKQWLLLSVSQTYNLKNKTVGFVWDRIKCLERMRRDRITKLAVNCKQWRRSDWQKSRTLVNPECIHNGAFVSSAFSMLG